MGSFAVREVYQNYDFIRVQVSFVLIKRSIN